MFEPSRSDMLAKLLPVSDHVTDLSLPSHPPSSPARSMLQPLMTIEEFLDKRPDLPESGQWTELRDGAPVSFDPPGVDHGTVILNLSKLLSEYVHQSDQGYAAFDVGVVLHRSPDFVVFPSVSYFLEGPRFAESDNAVATRPPAFVVEILSTPDRQREFAARAGRYLEAGIPLVWGIVPTNQTVDVLTQTGPARRALRTDHLTAAPVLPEFGVAVASLFVEPDWYSRPAPRKE